MDQTVRLALPLLQPGQAQKEITHNQALARLDALVCTGLENDALTTPPPAPAEGAAYLVAGPASGAWAGQEGKIASWTSAGWSFIAPFAGLVAWVRSRGAFGYHDGSQWRGGQWPVEELRVGGVPVVRARTAAIADPSGGTVVDAQARAALTAVLAALRAHGLIAP